MYSAVSSGLLLRKVHASSSERTVQSVLVDDFNRCAKRWRTFQSIDRPLLELLKCDFGRGWQYIEIETVLVIWLLKLCFGELFLFVTEIGTSFGLDPRVIVADHRWYLCSIVCC